MARVYEIQGLCVDVKYMVLGPIQNNVFIISDGKGTMVVDPSCQNKTILDALGGAKVDAIVATHHHCDHVDAAAELRRATGAPLIASTLDAKLIEHPDEPNMQGEYRPCKVDKRVKNGDVITVGGMQWKVMETPGHTKGSMCLYLPPQFGNHPDGLPVLISGDTLFAGATGRTDFKGGSLSDMAASMKKLAKLPDDVAVLPGHNELTTIGAERRRVFAHFGAR